MGNCCMNCAHYSERKDPDGGVKRRCLFKLPALPFWTIDLVADFERSLSKKDVLLPDICLVWTEKESG
jgi:hypothetical protein